MRLCFARKMLLFRRGTTPQFFPRVPTGLHEISVSFGLWSMHSSVSILNWSLMVSVMSCICFPHLHSMHPRNWTVPQCSHSILASRSVFSMSSRVHLFSRWWAVLHCKRHFMRRFDKAFLCHRIWQHDNFCTWRVWRQQQRQKVAPGFACKSHWIHIKIFLTRWSTGGSLIHENCPRIGRWEAVEPQDAVVQHVTELESHLLRQIHVEHANDGMVMCYSVISMCASYSSQRTWNIHFTKPCGIWIWVNHPGWMVGLPEWPCIDRMYAEASSPNRRCSSEKKLWLPFACSLLGSQQISSRRCLNWSPKIQEPLVRIFLHDRHLRFDSSVVAPPPTSKLRLLLWDFLRVTERPLSFFAQSEGAFCKFSRVWDNWPVKVFLLLHAVVRSIRLRCTRVRDVWQNDCIVFSVPCDFVRKVWSKRVCFIQNAGYHYVSSMFSIQHDNSGLMNIASRLSFDTSGHCFSHLIVGWSCDVRLCDIHKNRVLGDNRQKIKCLRNWQRCCFASSCLVHQEYWCISIGSCHRSAERLEVCRAVRSCLLQSAKSLALSENILSRQWTCIFDKLIQLLLLAIHAFAFWQRVCRENAVIRMVLRIRNLSLDSVTFSSCSVRGECLLTWPSCFWPWADECQGSWPEPRRILHDPSSFRTPIWSVLHSGPWCITDTNKILPGCEECAVCFTRDVPWRGSRKDVKINVHVLPVDMGVNMCSVHVRGCQSTCSNWFVHGACSTKQDWYLRTRAPQPCVRSTKGCQWDWYMSERILKRDPDHGLQSNRKCCSQARHGDLGKSRSCDLSRPGWGGRSCGSAWNWLSELQKQSEFTQLPSEPLTRSLWTSSKVFGKICAVAQMLPLCTLLCSQNASRSPQRMCDALAPTVFGVFLSIWSLSQCWPRLLPEYPLERSAFSCWDCSSQSLQIPSFWATGMSPFIRERNHLFFGAR